MPPGDPETELLTSAARLYYLDGLDQRQVAGILGVSRSKVSRMLTEARQRQIVRISVEPDEPRHTDLERRLHERFTLRHAIVVKAKGRGVDGARRTIGHVAAPVLATIIRPGMTIGVAGGRTVGELIAAFSLAEPMPNLRVVQLMGQIDPTARKIDAPELGRTLAARCGGPLYALHAPAFAQDRQARDAFLAHEQIRLIWRQFETLDLALVGIGSLADSVFAERGVLTAADYARLAAVGAVGEICGRFFDRDGRECASEYRDRVVSIGLEELARRADVVAVTNGSSRSAATLAALHGGLITSLMIDDLGAEALLAAPTAAEMPPSAPRHRIAPLAEANDGVAPLDSG